MGKLGKKRYNEKGRRQVETIIDNSGLKKIKVDLVSSDSYYANDEANLLVLPSEKRATQIKKSAKVVRILSKKQRKHLEKVVDKKKKKENRSSLIDSLKSVQISNSELKQLTSLTSIQTKGLKRHFHEQKFGIPHTKSLSASVVEDGVFVRNSFAGVKRKRLDESDEEITDDDEESKKTRDYNVVTLDASSESEEEVEIQVQKIENRVFKEEFDDGITVSKKIQEKNEKLDQIKKADEKLKQLNKLRPEVSTSSRKAAVYIHVERSASIQIARLKLPILAEEQIIMETISENSVIILAGETGSGKTTQIPQFLYEAGFAENGMQIAITEPRRVAAIAMSKRVGYEMGLNTDIVSYLIRFEGNCTDKTKLKFMTDGVLLKEIETDFLLNKYSVVILDEAHERSAYTDILVGLLSRIVLLRNKRKNPLKLIIMSATLRVEDFTGNRKLFKIPPPVIKVDARQFPVTIHFNKVTKDDYVNEAYLKAIKIHTKLPEGGILMFLTGQQEVKHLVKKLRKQFPFCGDSRKLQEVDHAKTEDQLNYSDDEELDKIFNIKKAIKNSKKNKKNFTSHLNLPSISLDSYQMPGDDTEADFNDTGSDGDYQGNLSDIEDDETEESDIRINELLAEAGSSQPLWVLPLYSLLPSYKQARVFEPPPEGTRLCVVATNVAETSLTIPNIKYVVDTGRQKSKFYDKVTGMSAFVVTFTSKAAANQRAGRAGRVAPGHCYRLYSSAVFNDDFVEFSPPEITEKPVDGLMLQMKCMGIDKVLNFPFPSPPDKLQLEMAEKRLMLLGALVNAPTKVNEFSSKVTKLGNSIAAFPVAPRFGKMLALSHQENLLEYTICMVAALSVQEVLQEVPLSSESGESSLKWRQKRKAWAGHQNSLLLGDPMILLKAVGAAEFAHSQNKLVEFCDENGLRLKAITEIRKLRVQLTNEINLNVPNLNIWVDPNMNPPTDQQAKLLRQILLAGLGDQVARKWPTEEIKLKEDKRKYKYAYQLPGLQEPIFMHSCSVLKKKQPEFVVFQEAFETRQGDGAKMFIRGITCVEPEWLVKFATPMCTIDKPLDDPAPSYDINLDKIVCHVRSTFGQTGWPLPIAEIEMQHSVDKFRYFAKFLLDGDIVEEMRKYKKYLLSTSNSMIKSWSKLLPRTEGLLAVLLNNKVDSKAKLFEEWKKDPKYLLSQYLLWLPESMHSKVTIAWPPVEK